MTPLKPTLRCFWVWGMIFSKVTLKLSLASYQSNHWPDGGTFSCSAMVTTPPTSPIGSVELLPHRCIHLLTGSFSVTWVGWGWTRKEKVSSWPNLETIACTDIVQPGVLYCSLHSTGNNPKAGGPPYGECNSVFLMSHFVLQIEAKFYIWVSGWISLKALCCVVKKKKVRVEVGREAKEGGEMLWLIVEAFHRVGNSSFLFLHYKIGDICVAQPRGWPYGFLWGKKKAHPEIIKCDQNIGVSYLSIYTVIKLKHMRVRQWPHV